MEKAVENGKSCWKISYGKNSRGVSERVENIERKSAFARDHHLTWSHAYLYGGLPLDVT